MSAGVGRLRARALARCAVVLAALVSAPGKAAENVSIEALRRDDAIEVTCRALVRAPLELIWGTLTDYDRLPEFIPGIRSSRVLEQRGELKTVHQSGEARFLFLSFPIDVTVASTERPPFDIDVRLLTGNLRKLEGSYRIEPLGGDLFALHWRGTIAPDAWLPPLVGEMLMRASIEDQFRGMVREIERRESARRDAGAAR